MKFYNDPGFWAFLSSLVAAVRWLFSVYFNKKAKLNIQKSTLDMTVESFKSTEAGKFVMSMQSTIGDLKKVTDDLKNFDNKFSSRLDQLELEVKELKSLKIDFALSNHELV